MWKEPKIKHIWIKTSCSGLANDSLNKTLETQSHFYRRLHVYIHAPQRRILTLQLPLFSRSSVQAGKHPIDKTLWFYSKCGGFVLDKCINGWIDVMAHPQTTSPSSGQSFNNNGNVSPNMKKKVKHILGANQKWHLQFSNEKCPIYCSSCSLFFDTTSENWTQGSASCSRTLWHDASIFSPMQHQLWNIKIPDFITDKMFMLLKR